MKTTQLIVAVLFFCVGTAYAQTLEWRQMNSQITVFAQKPENPDIIFAGDAAGLIRRSDDRGATWKTVSFQSESAINDIAFLNAQKGFAATAQPGLILITNDGGATWRRKQFVDAEKPETPHFHATARIIIVDDQTVFFDIFDHPISAPSTKESIVTRDGGATFKVESAPGEIYHISDGTMIGLGWEAGQFGLAKFTVYKSTDKGIIWNIIQTSPAGFINNDFNNEGVNLAVFLSADEFFITANRKLTSDKRVYKTTDGGLTFTPLANFPKAQADYLYFKNASEGFALTGNAGGYTAVTTTDGGATWTPSAKNVQSVARYLGNNTFIAYYDDHTAISTDFGKTWTEQADPLNTVRNTVGTPSTHFLQVIDDSVAVASLAGVSPDGTPRGGDLMKTIDGGLSWHRIKNAAGIMFSGTVFHFISKDTFFFIGSGYNESGTLGGYMKIKYTTDGGLTAKDMFTGEYTEDVREIVFIDKTHVVTYSLNLFATNYSTDGGQTWKKTLISTPMGQVVKMTFPAVDHWYAFTNNRNIFTSTDQGKSWSKLPDPKCDATSFTSAMTGYNYGCMNEFYRTADGGQTWVGSDLDTNLKYATFDIMTFQNETTGYAADMNPNGIYSAGKTTDGGKSWQWYTGSQISTKVAKIDFSNESAGAMMDVYGNFGKYVGSTPYTTDTLKISGGAVSVRETFSTESRISIYPNPAGDIVSIDTKDEHVQTIEITDLMGITRLRISAVQSLMQTIQTTGLPAGTYFVKISTARGIFSQCLTIFR